MDIFKVCVKSSICASPFLSISISLFLNGSIYILNKYQRSSEILSYATVRAWSLFWTKWIHVIDASWIFCLFFWKTSFSSLCVPCFLVCFVLNSRSSFLTIYITIIIYMMNYCSQVLYDFVFTLIHKNRVRKICFQRGFEFFKTISFIKKNVEGASKNEIS